MSGEAFVWRGVIEPTRAGVLDGLTFAVKDVIDVAGQVTGCGNPTWAATHGPAATHAVAVEVLLANGARCLGKTITDEFAFSLVGENHFYGTPRNGRAPNRVPGGSSCGSASAVSCGEVDFALGTDTAGSVRVPAANCGIYGLRPTWGRISTAGVQALAPSFDTVGILAKDLEVLRRVAGCFFDAEPVGEIRRLMVVREIWELTDEPVRRALEVELERLKGTGLVVEPIGLAELGEGELARDPFAWKQAFSNAQWPEVWSTFGGWITENQPEMGAKIAGNFALASKVDRTGVADATRLRERVSAKVRGFLGNDTALVVPTVPSPPPLLGQVDYDRTGSGYLPRMLCMTAFAGLCGLPQLSVPLATEEGLPMGISFVGGVGMDELLVRLGICIKNG